MLTAEFIEILDKIQVEKHSGSEPFRQFILKAKKKQGSGVAHLEIEKNLPELTAYFTNLSELVYFFEVAPPVFQEYRIAALMMVLGRLPPENQERQLAVLDETKLKDLLVSAITDYQKKQTQTEKAQHQKMTQAILFQWLQKKAEHKHALTSAERFYSALVAEIPQIGESDVLDDFSDYETTQGKSASALMQELSQKAFGKTPPWQNTKGATAQAQFHQAIRLGQGARREFAHRRKENLKRDLFWARGLSDSKVIDENPYPALVYQQIKDRERVSGEPAINTLLGVLSSKKSDDEKATEFLKSISQKLKETYGRGNVRRNFPPKAQDWNTAIKNLVISTINNLEAYKKGDDFSICISSKIDLDAICNLFKLDASGCLALRKGKPTDDLSGDDRYIQSKIIFQTRSAPTLSALRSQVEFEAQKLMPNSVRRPLLMSAAQRISVTSVNLDTKLAPLKDKQPLAKKLLGVMGCQSYLSDVGEPHENVLKAAFAQIQQDNFQGAVDISGIDEAVQQAMAVLSKAEQKGMTEQQKAFANAGKQLVSSSSVRQRKQDALDKALKLTDPAQMEEALSQIYQAEYAENAQALGLQSLPSERVADIQEMARESATLITRANQGKPAISEEEQAAYFEVIEKAMAVMRQNGHDPSQVAFKIKHAKKAQNIQLAVNKEGKEIIYSLELQLSQDLPYSLFKPEGDTELMLSYGGSRGALLPSQDVQAATQKSRWFTHSRLLGVGQYGSVKEVEGFLTGMNHVLKRGYVAEGEKTTFHPDALKDSTKRPLVSRDDPLYEIESTVMKALAEKLDPNGAAAFSTVEDKQRTTNSGVYQKAKPKQYKMLQARAKGQTWADATAAQVSLYDKQDSRYHHPESRGKINDRTLQIQIDQYLQLSQAVISEAQKFQEAGFSHNDIKPENFLFSQRADGTVEVKFIDWATGGFDAILEGTFETAEEAYQAAFPGASIESLGEGGRYVKLEDGRWHYGIAPNLELLGGACNGTLPYISPQVLDKNSTSLFNKKNAHTLEFQPTDHTLDDWALTVMTFGICHQETYFELVKQRAMGDYVVPGAIEFSSDVKSLRKGKNFDDLFQVEAGNNDIMYVPTTAREGEPMHLYRVLQARAQLLDTNDPNKTFVDKWLTEVREAVQSKKGFSKQQLSKLTHQMQAWLRAVENGQKYGKASQADLDFEERLAKHTIGRHPQKLTTVAFAELLKLAKTHTQKEALKNFLVKNYEGKPKAFHNELIQERASGSNLLMSMLVNQQEEIFCGLMALIPVQKEENKTEWVNKIEREGLLRIAVEVGATQAFTKLSQQVVAISGKEKLWELLLDTQSNAQLRMNESALEGIIKQNNPEMLGAILQEIPDNPIDAQVEALKKALLMAGKRGYVPAIQKIFDKGQPLGSITIDSMIDYNSNPPTLFQSLMKLPLHEHEPLLQQLIKSQSALETFIGETQHGLLWAAKEQQWETVEMLMADLTSEQKQGVLIQKDSNNCTLLDYAFESAQTTEKVSRVCEWMSEAKNPHNLFFEALMNPPENSGLSQYLSSETISYESRIEYFGKVLAKLSEEPDGQDSFEEEEANRYILVLLSHSTWVLSCLSQSDFNVRNDYLTDLLANPRLTEDQKFKLYRELEILAANNENARARIQKYKDMYAPQSGLLVKREAVDAIHATTTELKAVAKFKKLFKRPEEPRQDSGAAEHSVSPMNDGGRSNRGSVQPQSYLEDDSDWETDSEDDEPAPPSPLSLPRSSSVASLGESRSPRLEEVANPQFGDERDVVAGGNDNDQEAQALEVPTEPQPTIALPEAFRDRGLVEDEVSSARVSTSGGAMSVGIEVDEELTPGSAAGLPQSTADVETGRGARGASDLAEESSLRVASNGSESSPSERDSVLSVGSNDSRRDTVQYLPAGEASTAVSEAVSKAESTPSSRRTSTSSQFARQAFDSGHAFVRQQNVAAAFLTRVHGAAIHIDTKNSNLINRRLSAVDSAEGKSREELAREIPEEQVFEVSSQSRADDHAKWEYTFQRQGETLETECDRSNPHAFAEALLAVISGLDNPKIELDSTDLPEAFKNVNNIESLMYYMRRYLSEDSKPCFDEQTSKIQQMIMEVDSVKIIEPNLSEGNRLSR